MAVAHPVSDGVDSIGGSSASTLTSAGGGVHLAGDTSPVVVADKGSIQPTSRTHRNRTENSVAQSVPRRNQSSNKTSQLRRNFFDGESTDDDESDGSIERMVQKGVVDEKTGRPVIPRSCYTARFLWTESVSVLSPP